MDNEIQAPHDTQHHNIYVYIVAVVVVVFLVVGATLFKEFKIPSKTAPVQPTPTAVVRRGAMSLATVSTATKYSAGSLITIEVLGDSAGQDVVGFDALVSFDLKDVEFVAVQSRAPSFQVYSHVRGNMVSLTAVKSPQVKGTSILAKTPLAALTFRAKSKGTYRFELLTESGNETTKMINAANAQLRPTTIGLSIEVN